MSELKGAGFEVKELADAGAQERELREGGFEAYELREARFKVLELQQAGFAVNDVKEAGFGALEMFHAQFPLDQLSAVFSEEDMMIVLQNRDAATLKKDGKTALQLRKMNFDVKQLVEAKFKISELKEGGYTAADMREASIPAKDLKGVYAIEDCKEGGYTAENMRAGFKSTAIRLAKAGYTLDELWGGGYKDMKDLGPAFRLEELLPRGRFTAQALLAHVSFRELMNAGVGKAEIVEEGGAIKHYIHQYDEHFQELRKMTSYRVYWKHDTVSFKAFGIKCSWICKYGTKSTSQEHSFNGYTGVCENCTQFEEVRAPPHTRPRSFLD